MDSLVKISIVCTSRTFRRENHVEVREEIMSFFCREPKRLVGQDCEKSVM